ncbi:PREDICTED: uncharacterized protein LOC106820830 [Priapulus caudatus]|uniref:Uncharacterized protein LOC106820830 n=1 Tax=Priapulus caudatus TaxID=37621 RepID=A0ABM1F8W6_PRICU|nr:PREDICTED: uncharacterized protein LOC106820830 [Priapulus caudatus]
MAGKAIRRGSVKLMPLSAGNGDLNLLISQLRITRQTSKNLIAAQDCMVSDLVKWVTAEKSDAMHDVATHLITLNSLWTDVQNSFTEQLKEFRCQFEAILDGEKQVSIAKGYITSCEKREGVIQKDMKKISKKAVVDDMRNLQYKLTQTSRAKELAKIDYKEKVIETESLKLIRFRQGLLKLSDAFVELGQKCTVIFGAQRDVCLQIPDINLSNTDLMSYEGYIATKASVLRAQQLVMQYRPERHADPTESNSHDSLPLVSPPPPYNTEYSLSEPLTHSLNSAPPHLDSSNSSATSSQTNGAVGHRHPSRDTIGRQHRHRYGTRSRRQELPYYLQNTCDHPVYCTSNCNTNNARWDDDDGWGSDFDDEVCTAMGGTQIK